MCVRFIPRHFYHNYIYNKLCVICVLCVCCACVSRVRACGDCVPVYILTAPICASTPLIFDDAGDDNDVPSADSGT